MNEGGGLSAPAGSTDLVLRLPREDEEEEFLHAHRATSPVAPEFLHHYQEGMPLSRYLEVLADQARGTDLPPDLVPATFLFAFLGDRIVGRVSIRHSLNDFLRQRGGHIGYVVVPEFRRRGYATLILRLALQIAREKIGLGRVMLTCDEDNLASAKIIEKCGGRLEDRVPGDDPKVLVRRYWIEAG